MAVVKYFDAYNASLKSGTTRALRATFASTCGICLTGAMRLDDAHKAGHVIDGATYKLGPVTLLDLKPLAFQASITQAAATIKTTSGKVVKKYEGGTPEQLIFRVVQADGGLVIGEILE